MQNLIDAVVNETSLSFDKANEVVTFLTNEGVIDQIVVSETYEGLGDGGSAGVSDGITA